VIATPDADAINEDFVIPYPFTPNQTAPSGAATPPTEQPKS